MGERLKELRQCLRLTQQQFADRLGVKRATIAGTEARGTPMGDAMIRLICSTFHVKEQWLRNGTGDMFTDVEDPVTILATEYGLSTREAAFVRTFATMKTEERKAVLAWIERTAAEMAASVPEETTSPEEIEARIEDEVEAEMAKIREQLIRQKRVEAGLPGLAPRAGPGTGMAHS